ncbi:Trypsin 5G1 [Smittium culicis]|uniref:Trypsin 5G1 n=1 Tax=Smittium culicis TaxID=133412 RepID=A0A1R1YRY1_9FUNG|nr:Trypsin 5G1 [Smittium culicis]
MKFLQRAIIALVLTAISYVQGNNKTRIIGGVSSPIDAYPYATFIVDKTSGIVCGGTLIDKNWVLTAAHCMVDTNIENVRIIIGPKNIRKDQGVVIKNKYLHDKYDKVTQDNDICLLELQEPSNATPAVIGTEVVQDNLVLRAIGWGIESNGTLQPSNQLMQVDLMTISTDECRKNFTPFVGNANGKQICTGKTPGRDTCLGDSGGALLRNSGLSVPTTPITIGNTTPINGAELLSNKDLGVNSSNAASKFKLVGITSFGAWPISSKNVGLCASSDVIGIYTSVAKYLDFINSTTGLQLP